HVYMVSFPGQGHVNPLLRLGKRLADFGIFVTLCAPEFAGISIRKANKITDGVPTPLGRGMIQFEFFDDGWDLTNTNRHDLDSYLAQLERVGREKLPEMIAKQAEMGRPVSCLINNPFIPWVVDVAEELGIPSALLWVQSCACFAAYFHYYNGIVKFPGEDDPEIDVQIPHLPLLKHDEIPSFLHPETPYPFLRRAILGQFKNIHKPFCVLMDTFQELESEIVDYMSQISRPIKTIGPLFRNRDTPETEAAGKSKTIRADFFTADDCLDWLGEREPKSVVYISFGSIADLEQSQIDEIAHGILSAGVSFLWVLRPPAVESTAAPLALPDGFLEKAGDKGRVVKWAPQVEVLAHPSTACFLTHTGWNSTMEALTCGVPLLLLPQWGDQVTNAKFLSEVYGVGLRLGRGEAEHRIVPREEVAECVSKAVSGEHAAEMRNNALKWKMAAEEAVAEGGRSDRNLRDFAGEI
ncbi:hypothetical protein M569_05215, partial [Genlisea aurea]